MLLKNKAAEDNWINFLYAGSYSVKYERKNGNRESIRVSSQSVTKFYLANLRELKREKHLYTAKRL